MDYKTFFLELKEEYKKNKINFCWDWDESQQSFELKQNYVVFVQESDQAIFEENCYIVAGHPQVHPQDPKSQYFNNFYAKNNSELISFIVFYLANKISKISETIHNRMIFMDKNHWSNCYFSLIGGKLISKSILSENTLTEKHVIN